MEISRKTVSAFPLLTLALLILFCSERLYAATQTQWYRQGGGVITNGTLEYERENCGGVDGYLLELTEGKYTTLHYRDYAYCPGEYNLRGNINFDVPPLTIYGKELVSLQASGTQTGTRTCCFINDWFKYSVSCDSGGYGLYGLDNSTDKEFVELIEGGDGVESVNVSDDLDVILYLPDITSSATKCEITGYTSGGGNIKWTYYPVDVETPETKIIGLTGVLRLDDQGDSLKIVVRLENMGPSDSGNIKITTQLVTWWGLFQSYQLDDIWIPYTIGDNERTSVQHSLVLDKTKYDFSNRCEEYPNSQLVVNMKARMISENPLVPNSEREYKFVADCQTKTQIFNMIMGIMGREQKK